MNYFLQAIGIVKQTQDAAIEKNVIGLERSFVSSSATSEEKEDLKNQIKTLKRCLSEKDKQMHEEIARSVKKAEEDHNKILQDTIAEERKKAEQTRVEAIDFMKGILESERKSHKAGDEEREKECKLVIAKEIARSHIEKETLLQQIRAKDAEISVLKGEMSSLRSSYQEMSKRLVIADDVVRKEKLRTDELSMKVDQLAKQLASVGAIAHNISLKNPNEVAAPIVSQVSETRFTPAETNKIYEGSKVFPGGNIQTFMESIPKDSIGKSAVNKIEVPDNLAERLKSLKAAASTKTALKSLEFDR